MAIDYGRGEYVRLMAARDAAIRRLVDQGYEFVTNAFRPGSAPTGVRTKDPDGIVARLRRDGYEVEVASAYNETGDILSSMVSIWRLRKAGPPRSARRTR